MGLLRCPLPVAAGFLRGVSARLGLDTCSLHLDAGRLYFCRRLLGLCPRRPGALIRARLLACRIVWSAGMGLPAVLHNPDDFPDGMPVRTCGLSPLLFWRLL